jgi:hypothetical protein
LAVRAGDDKNTLDYPLCRNILFRIPSVAVRLFREYDNREATFAEIRSVSKYETNIYGRCDSSISPHLFRRVKQDRKQTIFYSDHPTGQADYFIKATIIGIFIKKMLQKWGVDF